MRPRGLSSFAPAIAFTSSARLVVSPFTAFMPTTVSSLSTMPRTSPYASLITALLPPGRPWPLAEPDRNAVTPAASACLISGSKGLTVST